MQQERNWRDIVFKLAISSIVVIGLYGCTAPTVKTEAVRAAKFDGPTQLKKIAVMPFNGKNGGEFAAMLENKLAAVKIDGLPYFQVIGADGKKRGIGNGSKPVSGVDTSKAVRFGQKLGVKGVYAGDVMSVRVDSSRFNEKRSRCNSYEKSGKFLKKCVSSSEYTVSCTRKKGSAEVAVRLIEVASGQVVFSDNYTSSITDQRCSDSSSALASDASMVDSVTAGVIGQVRRDVAPYVENFNFAYKENLYGKGESTFGSQAEGLLQRGAMVLFGGSKEIPAQSESKAPRVNAKKMFSKAIKFLEMNDLTEVS
jgi:hypothetical protein